MVKVNISGVTITYYMDEIARIDGGQDLAPSSAASVSAVTVAPAAVPSTTPQAASPMAAMPLSSGMMGSAGKPPKELVLRYLTLSGTENTLDQMFQEMIENSSPQDAGRLSQAYDLGEIMEILVPVYQKYFTDDDMRKLVEFYQSSVAKKLNETTPMIIKDTLDAAMLYFRTKLPPRSGSNPPAAQTP
jgi:hypothetical protein